MCLSEPQAGSTLADITTKATLADDGSWRLTGTKMWISAGEHELSENNVHLVLAKTPGAPAGVKGISLFIAPKYLADGTRNDIALVGLNHKMGNRGTTNCLLNFGDGTHSPTPEKGAVAYLVGEEHLGLTYMFHMMNEARIGVGFLATAIGTPGISRRWSTRRRAPRVARSTTRTRRRRRCPSSTMLTSAGCWWRRRPTSKAHSRSGSTPAHSSTRSRPPRAGPRRRAPAPRRAHPDREELAVTVVSRGQQPGHPGARRLRLHARLRRRAVLPRQPPQPHPRGRARHPRSRPARPQGGDERRQGLTAARLHHHGDRRARRGRRWRGRGVRRRTPVRCRPSRRGHGGGVVHRRPDRLARERDGLPRGRRSRGGQLDLVGTAASRSARSRATSTTASAPPPATSSATSCRRPGPSSSCSPRWTARHHDLDPAWL